MSNRKHTSRISITGVGMAYTSMFNDTSFSDIQIKFKASSNVLYVHRNILAFHSEVLKAMFLSPMQESLSNVVNIEDDDEELFIIMIKSFYTGMIEINEQKMASLAELADKYRCKNLENKCFEYLAESMNESNCLSCLFLNVEDNQRFNDLREAAYRFIGLQFNTLSHSSTFLLLDFDKVSFILSREDLLVDSEDRILEFVITWVEVDLQDRLQFVNTMFQECVRLHYVSTKCLYFLFEKKYIKENIDLLRIVTEASLVKHSIQDNVFETPTIKYQKPRECATHVFESILLNAEQQLQLSRWYAEDNTGRRKWILCYRASRDGYEARNFHTFCDKRGETITVIKSRVEGSNDENGYLFGGYTSKSWDSPNNEEYIYDDKAWLYSLTNPTNHRPIKLRVHANKFAICNHVNFGPRYGDGSNSFDGRDVCIQNNCGARNDNYSNPGKSYTLPSGYHFNSTAAKRFFTGQEKFVVNDMEVFYSQRLS
ncbi:hypothetical protein AKO1_002919 [Acrasis kona]|uniref:BTB/POZ domain-containing protein n=1 Tax=Acrasis kona TaxID=1008807 RepID=A0AAW2YT62_9EUKA